jgi:hypothetical protein
LKLRKFRSPNDTRSRSNPVEPCHCLRLHRALSSPIHFFGVTRKPLVPKPVKKARPCVIVVAVRDETGDTAVYVAPITHSKPVDPVGAVSLPQAVKRRLGLDAQPSWIITTELNRFIWPGYDLAPISRENPDTYAWGFLPGSIFAAVKRSILANRHRQRLAVTGRD